MCSLKENTVCSHYHLWRNQSCWRREMVEMGVCPSFIKKCPMVAGIWQRWPGNDILLEADENVADLRVFHFKKHWKAKNGEPGRGAIKTVKEGAIRFKLPLALKSKKIQVVFANFSSWMASYFSKEEGGRRKPCFQVSVNQTPAITEGKAGVEANYLVHS